MLGNMTKTALGFLCCNNAIVSFVLSVRSTTFSPTGSIDRTKETGSSFPLLLSVSNLLEQSSCSALLLVISRMQSTILVTVSELSLPSMSGSSSNVGGEVISMAVSGS